MAKLLGLPYAEEYTGHCWRRTAITMMADAGMSAPQICAASGHKSQAVAQGYVDNSEYSKRKASEALAVGKKSRYGEHGENNNCSTSNSNCSTASASAAPGANVVYNINLCNAVISGALSLFGGSTNPQPPLSVHDAAINDNQQQLDTSAASFDNNDDITHQSPQPH